MKKLFPFVLISLAFVIGYLLNYPQIQPKTEETIIEIPEITFDTDLSANNPNNVSFLASWQIISDKGDDIVIKKDGDVNRYAFIIDYSKLNLSVVGVKTEQTFLEIVLQDTGIRPICAFGGARFDRAELHSPVIQDLPLIENGNLTPGKNTEKYPARILYIDGDLRVVDIASNNEVQPAKYGISGLSPDYYQGSLDEPELSVISIKGDSLILLALTNITVDETVALLTNEGVEENNIIVLNDSFLRYTCYEGEYSWTHTMVGSAILVTAK